MASLTLAEGRHGVTFEVRVVPSSPRCGLAQEDDGRLKVRVDAPPVDGEANDRLLRYLSKDVFGVPRASLRILKGEHGRNKTVAVDLPLDDVRERLERALASAGRTSSSKGSDR